MHHKETGFMRPRCQAYSWLLTLLSVCSAGAIYAVNDPAADEPKYCTLFHHQVKSAGTTIKDKLETASLEAGVGKPGLCVAGHGFEQSCLQVLSGSYPVVAGCVELVRRPLEKRGRGGCDFFTVMRHPIDRLVSAFFYCPEHDPQDRPRMWCGFFEGRADVTAVSREERLLEFARLSWKNKAFVQMTHGMFCPKNAYCERAWPGPPQNIDEPGGLEVLQQVEHLLSTYTAVGILEHWNTTMDLFNARIKSPVRDWQAVPEHLAHFGVHQANAGVYNDIREQVHQWARTSPEVHAILATDLLLYEFAVTLFKHQTAVSLGVKWE